MQNTQNWKVINISHLIILSDEENVTQGNNI